MIIWFSRYFEDKDDNVSYSQKKYEHYKNKFGEKVTIADHPHELVNDCQFNVCILPLVLDRINIVSLLTQSLSCILYYPCRLLEITIYSCCLLPKGVQHLIVFHVLHLYFSTFGVGSFHEVTFLQLQSVILQSSLHHTYFLFIVSNFLPYILTIESTIRHQTLLNLLKTLVKILELGP